MTGFVYHVDHPRGRAGGSGGATAGGVPQRQHLLLAMQRAVGNQAVTRAMAAVQRCGPIPADECPCHDNETTPNVAAAPAGATSLQRDAGVLEWGLEVAERAAPEIVKDVGIGLGAVAAGVAVGAGILLTPNTSIMSGSEEQWRLGYAHGQGAVRGVAQTAAEITAMAAITQADVDRWGQRVDGVVAAIEEFLRTVGRQAMRCSAAILAFRAAVQALRDYLAQPLDQIDKFRAARLHQDLESAMQALLDCLGAAPPTDNGPQTG